ncbi:MULTISPECIES: thioesterase II family protein [unclassified Streptomyces]|uniref:thioesterase II family protein n=1 Tax=unclassified Streptomyces TaxID=2593676 RepID=UPI0038072B5D
MTAHSEDGDLWIRRYHPTQDSDIRLLCLPHAGGSASFYFPVSAALAPRTEVLAVQYPGRQDRRLEPCVPSLPELADRLLPLVLNEWSDRPLALFGHSMGASLAFELAGLLEKAGVEPVMLFASGRRAPSRFRVEEDVHTRGDEALLAEVKRLAGTDTRILGDDEMLRMVLPALRADYRAAELYRPERVHQVNCPVTALVGDDDPKASLDDVRVWQEHTRGDFAMEVYPGGHFYLTEQAPAVLRRITEALTGTTTNH